MIRLSFMGLLDIVSITFFYMILFLLLLSYNIPLTILRSELLHVRQSVSDPCTTLHLDATHGRVDLVCRTRIVWNMSSAKQCSIMILFSAVR
jgi:hypothetical protein